MFADAGNGIGIKINNNPTSKDWPRIPPLTLNMQTPAPVVAVSMI
jgi:hypothetical protein